MSKPIEVQDMHGPVLISAIPGDVTSWRKRVGE